MSANVGHLGLAVALTGTLLLSACATGEQAAVAPDAVSSEAPAESATPLPLPSELPVEEPTEEILDAIDDYDEQTYPRTWSLDGWASVPVPAAPTPRLTVTCAQLLDAAGRPAGVRLATVQPTISTVGARQAGSTACAFALDLPSGTSTATLIITPETSVVNASSAVRCFAEEFGVGPVRCYGTAVADGGLATITYEMPPGTNATQGTAEAGALVQAANEALSSAGDLRTFPTVNPSAMGALAGGCNPTPEQRTAVFSQVDVYDGRTDVYQFSPETPLGQWEAIDRLMWKACSWWFGWDGAGTVVIPGGGWAVGEAGVLGTPVTVLGADAALRVERAFVEDNGDGATDKVEIVVIASARGSAVFTYTWVDPERAPYWRERLVGITEAIVGTQP